MLIEPKRLIDRSIADLTQLSALFEAEVRDATPVDCAELRACEEAVVTINKLIPRLQIARNARITALPTGYCPNCEDG